MSESKQPAKRSSPRTKRAKVSQPPEDEDQALDLSLHKPKTSRSKSQPKKSINIECPMMNQISPPADKKHIWGCLQFYESGKPVYCEYLSGDDPIEVNTRKIVQSKALTVEKDANEELYNSILKSYADWEHVLENGFTLKRKENGEYSSIEMRSMDMSDKKQPKYKIFVEDKQISIRDPTDIYEIYDGEKILGDKLKQPLGDMNKAYELAHCCHLIIAVYGEFMSAVGPIPLTYDSIRREMLPHYPYWFYLKIYPEFYLLDLKARQLFASNLK